MSRMRKEEDKTCKCEKSGRGKGSGRHHNCMRKRDGSKS